MLTLNYNKTHFMQFTCKSDNNINLSINYNNNHISNIWTIKFLGLMLDTNLTLRNHIDYLHSTLSSASYAIRILKIFYASINSDKYLLLILTFNNIIRNNFLANFTTQSFCFQATKKGNQNNHGYWEL
jgi:hypothetical protein